MTRRDEFRQFFASFHIRVLRVENLSTVVKPWRTRFPSLTKEHMFYIIPPQMPDRSWKDFFRFGRRSRRRYDWEGEVHGWLRDLIDSAVADGQARRELMREWGALTLREQQITALVCLGYTNPQIAGRLRLSVETVKTHIKNVLLKYRLHSKTELRLMFSSWDFGEWER